MKEFQTEKDAQTQQLLQDPNVVQQMQQTGTRRNAEDPLLTPQLNKEQQQQVGGQGPQDQTRKPEEVPEILYGGENVDVPSLFRIKLQVLAHPAFKAQGGRMERLEGSADAYILFYWVVIQHHKIESDTKVSEFRNVVFQRARTDRLTPTAQWLAQASKDEYNTTELVDYLVGRKDHLENVWEKDMVQTDNEAELDLAINGEYKDWGRVSAKNMGYFPLIDFVRGDFAVSLKTVDPYDAAAVDRIKAHMEELAARKPGREVEKETDDDKRGKEKEFKAYKLQVDLRVPPGSEDKVAELIEYGRKLDIDVKITPHGQPLLADKLRPGDKVPRPGEYIERGPHGEEVPDALRVTMEQNASVLPATSKPDRIWERVSPPKPELPHPAHEKQAQQRQQDKNQKS